jgi:hypothetical protein
VVLESTGGSWQPIDPVLVVPLEGVVATARSVRQRPGQKKDSPVCVSGPADESLQDAESIVDERMPKGDLTPDDLATVMRAWIDYLLL